MIGRLVRVLSHVEEELELKPEQRRSLQPTEGRYVSEMLPWMKAATTKPAKVKNCLLQYFVLSITSFMPNIQ